MQQFVVSVKTLNKRKVVPVNFPDSDNIIGEVKEGFSFEGEEVAIVPNPNLGKWYKDRDGHFYWGGGVKEFLQGESSPQVDWWITALNLPHIWKDFDETGDKATVAILDSGFNVNIPDLKDGVKDSKIFFNSVAGNPVTIDDTFGHGSHCTSLIGGRNKSFVTGCAPSSGLFIAKICSQGAVRNFSIMVEAIKWAIANMVDIISISYGGESPDNDLRDIINSAVNTHNIIVIAAIGDMVSNSTNAACFPALYDDCIAVGASNDQQQVAAITIVNKKTEINAPGENILGYGLTDQLISKTGTSQAAAIVAGICALIVSRHKKTGKLYSVKSIRDLIIQNADIVSNDEKIISPFKIFSKI